MMRSAGQWNCPSAQLIASFSGSFLTAMSAFSCLKGWVQSRVALHPDFSTEAITSSSIARANASRSSWLRMQERRVLGFVGLKGMSAWKYIVKRLSGQYQKGIVTVARRRTRPAVCTSSIPRGCQQRPSARKNTRWQPREIRRGSGRIARSARPSPEGSCAEVPTYTHAPPRDHLFEERISPPDNGLREPLRLLLFSDPGAGGVHHASR
ncbi:hypothetical protein DSECCO2_412690 [anaerobic digester metagenome]